MDLLYGAVLWVSQERPSLATVSMGQLNNRVLHYAYLEQIGNRYDLTDELELFGRHGRGPSKSDQVYPHCESIISNGFSAADL